MSEATRPLSLYSKRRTAVDEGTEVMTKRSSLDQKPSKAELEKQLDDALKQTFPASDPVAVGEPTAFIPDRPVDRQAPLTDKELVNELAANVEARHPKADSASRGGQLSK
jgi:hypothetical protein